MMIVKKNKFKLLGVIAFAIITIFSIIFFTGDWLTSDAEKQKHLPTAKVVRGDLQEKVTATGTLNPRDYVDVGAQISGQLVQLYVEVGSEVKKGQLLAEIDAKVQAANVAASRAQLRAQAAQLRDRKAQLTLAEQHHARQKRLRADGAVTEQAVQEAIANFLSSKAQVDQLEAQIEQNQSSLEADEANLEYARIVSPIDGTVVSIAARQGQTLNANQQAPLILQVADLTQMRVETQVSEADISRLYVGMKAYFTTLGSKGQSWQGDLLRIEPTPVIENNVVLYNAPFDVENSEGKLLPKMTAQVFFIVAEASDALLIPSAALQKAGRKGYQVAVLLEDGQQEMRKIKVGVNNRIQAQVLKGLKEGEVILLKTTLAKKRTGDRKPRMFR